MDMLCIAAAHDPIGYVAVAGRGLSETDIARMTGGSESEVHSLLGDLERNGVFSRDRKGTIYSRRMVADARKAAIAKKNGKNGGNPNLCKQRDFTASDNPPDKVGVKPQEPETNNQRPEGSGLPAAAGARKPYPSDFEEFWAGYPVDRNMSKKAAFKRWQALKPQQRANAIASLPAFRAYCDENKSWYRPKHAEGYLSQERFDGFLEASRRAAGGDLPEAPDWGSPGQKLIEAIGEPIFAQWFGGGAVELITGDPVRIVADKPYRRNWIAKNYQGALAQAFGTDVVIECNDNRTSDGRTIR